MDHREYREGPDEEQVRRRRGRAGARWLGPLLLGALILSLPGAARAAPLTTIYVNGTKIAARPLVRDGVAYLPITSMAQALEVAITWDSRLNIVKVEDEVVAATPFPVEGRIYLPVESFVAALGGKATWDGRRHAILIDTKGGSGQPGASLASRTTVPLVPPRSSSTPPAHPAVSPSPTPVPEAPDLAGIRSRVYQPPPAASTATSAIPGYRTPPVDPIRGGADLYVPRIAQNAVFQVTVTNVETVSVIKDFYKPRTGYKFVIVYLSQQNISNEVQIYTGKFTLVDDRSRSYDAIEGLSNFWLVILRPYGINFGYLVYEIPADRVPRHVVLHTLNQSPLTIDL